MTAKRVVGSWVRARAEFATPPGAAGGLGDQYRERTRRARYVLRGEPRRNTLQRFP